MYYYETNERKGKVIGGIAAFLYIALWVVLMLFVSFNFDLPETGAGILVNFGDVESASGIADPADNELTARNQQQAAQQMSPEETITQDFEDAPEVIKAEDKQNPEETRTDRNKTQNQVTTQEPQRQVNQQALFPGRTQGSTSTSEGTASTGAGNQGVQEGNPAGSHDGTGTGSGGTGFNLAGRNVVGALPQPDYGANKEGRVIVEITVSAAGTVTNASYRARGSTTNDSELVNAALKAARQSRFNKIDGDGLQTGTITYNFKLK